MDRCRTACAATRRMGVSTVHGPSRLATEEGGLGGDGRRLGLSPRAMAILSGRTARRRPLLAQRAGSGSRHGVSGGAPQRPRRGQTAVYPGSPAGPAAERDGR